MEIQIISGFLGAGKTTFLNRYLPILKGSTAVIENEFGDIGLDGELIQGDVPVREIYAGCICCSLALDFRQGIKEIAQKFNPDRIIIEPSGVGRLSDIIKACQKARDKDGINLKVTKLITIVDITLFEEYVEGFGAFYLDQIENAGVIFPSHMNQPNPDEQKKQIAALKKYNPHAVLYEGDYCETDDMTLKELIRLSHDYEEGAQGKSSPALPADRVFSSIAFLNLSRMSEEQVLKIPRELKKDKYGQILRAKGVLNTEDNRKIHFDYTPSAPIYQQMASDTGVHKESGNKVIIIGCGLDKQALKELFQS